MMMQIDRENLIRVFRRVSRRADIVDALVSMDASAEADELCARTRTVLVCSTSDNIVHLWCSHLIALHAPTAHEFGHPLSVCRVLPAQCGEATEQCQAVPQGLQRLAAWR